MSALIYAHPDGPKLEYTDGELIATDPDGNSIALPIGPAGLSALATELASLADDSGNLAEQAGAGIGMNCLNDLLGAKKGTQGHRIHILQSAIMELIATANPARAAAGFSMVTENVIVRGLAVLI